METRTQLKSVIFTTDIFAVWDTTKKCTQYSGIIVIDFTVFKLYFLHLIAAPTAV